MFAADFLHFDSLKSSPSNRILSLTPNIDFRFLESKEKTFQTIWWYSWIWKGTEEEDEEEQYSKTFYSHTYKPKSKS